MLFGLAWDGCALYHVRGRIEQGVYTSPDGGFRVRVPALVRPGARVEDGTPDAGVFSVWFRDDLCRIYLISEWPSATEGQSLESWTEQQIVPRLQQAQVEILDRKTVDTRWGPAIFVHYFRPRGGPCVSAWVSSPKDETPPVGGEPPDAEFAMYLLHRGRSFYQVLYGAGENSGASGAFFDAQTFPVEEKVKSFLDSFEPLLREPTK